MSNRRFVVIAAALGISVGLAMWLFFGDRAQAQAQLTHSVATGRYVAVAPSQNYSNFLWVVDSATGEVTAFRVAGLEDETGKHLAWVTERLMSNLEYIELEDKLRKRSTSEN